MFVMKKINELKLPLLLIGITGLVLSACYDAFDTKSYAPVFTINGFSGSNQIQSTSLVAYWGFENSLADSVSNSVGINKGATFDRGFKGSALSVNASNKSYVTFDPGTSITGLHSLT